MLSPLPPSPNIQHNITLLLETIVFFFQCVCNSKNANNISLKNIFFHFNLQMWKNWTSKDTYSSVTNSLLSVHTYAVRVIGSGSSCAFWLKINKTFWIKTTTINLLSLIWSVMEIRNVTNVVSYSLCRQRGRVSQSRVVSHSFHCCCLSCCCCCC
jgi:hypothetical protein